MATKLITSPGDSGAQGMKRRWGTISLAIHTSLASCDVLDAREFKDIAIKPPASVTAVDVYSSESEAGTYVLVDSIGTNGQVAVVASKWNVLDITKIGPLGFLKFVSTGSTGTAVIQGKT